MEEPQFISMIQLIQQMEKYHGKTVRVIGFASLEFEGKALYVGRDDFENGITKNAAWLDVKLTPETQELHKKYVIVEGEFDQDQLGHLKLFSGTITKVTRLELWSAPKP